MIREQIGSYLPRIEKASLGKKSIIGIIGPTGSGKSSMLNYFQ